MLVGGSGCLQRYHPGRRLMRVMISSVPAGFSPTPPSVLLSGLAGAGEWRAGWLVLRAPMRAA